MSMVSMTSRVTPIENYAIPADNPSLSAVPCREIWAYGLRNPWKASFAPNGDLYIGDVGQNFHEEINRQPAGSTGGENYEWNTCEGTYTHTGDSRIDGQPGCSVPGGTGPILDYAHGSGPDQGNSVVGGFVYDGPIAEFQGLYIFADSGSHNIWTWDPNNPTLSRPVRINDQLVPDQNAMDDGLFGFDIVAFSEDGSGNLYVIQIDGDIHKITKNLPGTHTVIVAAGEVEDVDFGNQDPQASSISDFVWEDDNANGVQDAGELGRDGVVVNLLDPMAPLRRSARQQPRVGGLYSFGGLAAGDYVVEFVAPTVDRFSPQIKALIQSTAMPIRFPVVPM